MPPNADQCHVRFNSEIKSFDSGGVDTIDATITKEEPSNKQPESSSNSNNNDDEGMGNKNSNDDEKQYITNPEQWLSKTVKGPDLFCLVFFRGSWCKYDRYYLRQLGEYFHNINKNSSDGNDEITLVAWTSEGLDGAKKADEEWELSSKYGYKYVLGDESNALANWLKEDEVLPNLVTVPAEEHHAEEENSASDHDKIAALYPSGIVLPAMVWYAHHGNIVFSWCAEPRSNNKSCAAEAEEEATPTKTENGCPDGDHPYRCPDPAALWETVIAKRKHALDLGNDVVPSHGGPNLKMCNTSGG